MRYILNLCKKTINVIVCYKEKNVSDLLEHKLLHFWNSSPLWSYLLKKTAVIYLLFKDILKLSAINFFWDEVEDFDHEIKLNHYKIISEDYFKTVKAVRGGGSSGISRCYTMEYFYKHEEQWKDVEDNELKNKLYPPQTKY